MAICKSVALLRCKSRSTYQKLFSDEDEEEDQSQLLDEKKVYNKFHRLKRCSSSNSSRSSYNNNTSNNSKAAATASATARTTTAGVKRMMRIRKRWMRRMVVRKKRLRFSCSWLSPLEIFRRLRQVYIQAVLREGSDPSKLGFVVASHWSFPIIIPFHVAAAAAQ